MKKRTIITMVLAGFLGLANAQNTSITEGHVQSATAISRVLGDGRKVETIVLQYDAPIRNKSLSAESFKVEGKDVAYMPTMLLKEQKKARTDSMSSSKSRRKWT